MNEYIYIYVYLGAARRLALSPNAQEYGARWQQARPARQKALL